MATTRKRRSIDEIIAEQEEKLKALKAAKRNAAKGKKEITRDSDGVANLLVQLEGVARANKVKKPVLIRALAKLTRSGLKFVD